MNFILKIRFCYFQRLTSHNFSFLFWQTRTFCLKKKWHSWMDFLYFPPVFENLPGGQSDNFLPFLKICQDDSRTFSSFFWKFDRMTVRHFPPIFENLPRWQSDIFLSFSKICQENIRTEEVTCQNFEMVSYLKK